jgi:hypothetical protein
MPAIVLLNPEDTRSLFKKSTKKEKEDYEYWQKNAFIHIMGKSKKFDRYNYVLLTLKKIKTSFLIYLFEI